MQNKNTKRWIFFYTLCFDLNVGGAEARRRGTSSIRVQMVSVRDLPATHADTTFALLVSAWNLAFTPFKFIDFQRVAVASQLLKRAPAPRGNFVVLQVAKKEGNEGSTSGLNTIFFHSQIFFISFYSSPRRTQTRNIICLLRFQRGFCRLLRCKAYET